jgi:hypothetical protein
MFFFVGVAGEDLGKEAWDSEGTVYSSLISRPLWKILCLVRGIVRGSGKNKRIGLYLFIHSDFT